MIIKYTLDSDSTAEREKKKPDIMLMIPIPNWTYECGELLSYNIINNNKNKTLCGFSLHAYMMHI